MTTALQSSFKLAAWSVWKVPQVFVFAQKVIQLCSLKWRDILVKFDEQLNLVSNHHDPKEIDRAAEVNELLEQKQLLGEISNTQAANLKDFVKRCHGLGYKNVQKSMSQQLFLIIIAVLKKLTGFDVKTMCLEALPIMRNMHTRSYGKKPGKSVL